jgi:hypothetical protein
MKRVIDIFLEIDGALEYCHEQGFVFVPIMIGNSPGVEMWNHAFISDEDALVLKLLFPDVDIYDEDDLSIGPKRRR